MFTLILSLVTGRSPSVGVNSLVLGVCRVLSI